MAAISFNALFLLLASPIAMQVAQQPRTDDPTSAYEKRKIEGFTVLLNRRRAESHSLPVLRHFFLPLK